MLYVVWDNGLLVMSTLDEREARVYANYRVSLTGSRVTVSEYKLVTSDEVRPDDD